MWAYFRLVTSVFMIFTSAEVNCEENLLMHLGQSQQAVQQAPALPPPLMLVVVTELPAQQKVKTAHQPPPLVATNATIEHKSSPPPLPNSSARIANSEPTPPPSGPPPFPIEIRLNDGPKMVPFNLISDGKQVADGDGHEDEVSKLERLGKLYESGFIDKSEFDLAKKKILAA